MSPHHHDLSAPGCPECARRREPQCFTYTVPGLGDYGWDSTALLAAAAAADPPLPVIEIGRKDLAAIVARNEPDPGHFDHVDPAEPGLAIQVRFPGDPTLWAILADGSHRAGRCLRDGLPFRCRVAPEGFADPFLVVDPVGRTLRLTPEVLGQLRAIARDGQTDDRTRAAIQALLAGKEGL